MKVFSSLEPALRRSLLSLFASGFLFWASLAALLPTLSLYLQDIGASKPEIGIVMGAFAIGLLLFRPWLGQIADRQGRKGVLLLGVVVVATAPLCYLFTNSIPLLIAIRAFHGLSIAAFTTAFSTLVVDLAPAQNRGEVIGYMSLVNPIGMAVGPALGGFVQAWAGYTPLFLLSAGLGVGAIGCAFAVKPPSSQLAEPTSQSRQTSPFWHLVLSSRLRTPTLVMLMIGLAFGVLSTFLPLFIQEIKVNLNAGLFYTAAAIASFLARLLTGRASDRYGRGRFITLGLMFYTVAMLMLWVANSPALFLVAGALEGAGAGIFLPMMVALLADRSHADERGRIFSLCIAGFDLGIAIAGPLLGFGADQIGYRGLFGVASGLACLALCLFISLSSKSLAHSLRFALAGGQDGYAIPRQAGG